MSLRNQPEDYHYEDDRRRIVYVHSDGHSPLAKWMLGIAATLVTGSIIACVALLWSMNATMTVMVYRQDKTDEAVKEVRDALRRLPAS